MMKFKFSFLMLAVFITVISGLGAHSLYVTYKNESYNYSISLPSSWHSAELNLKDKHILYAYPDKYTKIKIKALRSDEQDLEKITSSNKWNIRMIDPQINHFIETGKISIKKNIFGKLLVCDYRSNRNKYLQRTLITINEGIIYVIECKSPISRFYQYEHYFNTSLSSFTFLSTGTTENK